MWFSLKGRIATRTITVLLFTALFFSTNVFAQSAYPSVPESVERQLEARGANLALHINKGRGSFDYRKNFCEALADGTKTLAELRDAAINAKVNDQPAAYNALSNVADDLQRGPDKWLDYYVKYCYPET